MRPVIEQIYSYDAKLSQAVHFYYGGNKSFGSKLNVYDVNNFSTPVYTNTVINTNETNVINPGVLKNGKRYAAEIISYDNSNEASEVSNKVYFWCYSTPQFYFNNVEDGSILRQQSLTVELVYKQEENVDISKFRYELYDSNMALISNSEYQSNYNLYSTYDYKGLENNKAYYIRACGYTTSEQPLDTGYISIFMQYESPNNYSVLYAEANNGEGIINYNTNIKLIDPTRRDYDFDFGGIYLIDDTITYESNFVIDGDFVMAIRHKYGEGQLLKCSNGVNGFTLSIIKDGDKYRYLLDVPNGDNLSYILISNPFEMDDKILTCWIRRINNIYELTVFEEKDFYENYTLFLGQMRPLEDLTKYDVWIDTDDVPTIRVERDDVVVWLESTEPSNPEENNIWIGGE